MTLELDVAAVPRDELPALLGRLVELEARVRIRLVEAPSPAPALRLINADEGAAIAGTSKRWLLSRTRGLGFRRDLSRKRARFDEAGLREWLGTRRVR